MIIQASNGNTGLIYLGDVTVDANSCLEISKGSSAVLNIDDLSDNEVETYIDLNEVYVDAASNGDSVHVFYLVQVEAKYNQ